MLLKHSDPRMAFPEESFDPQGNVAAAEDAFAFGDPARGAALYITWDAELQHAMADRAFVLNQLLVRTETSPVLLGLKEGGPDAYKKVRLESFNSLTKAARKAAYWRAGIRRGARRRAGPGERAARRPALPARPIAVQLRDGIPADEKEAAERLATLRARGSSRSTARSKNNCTTRPPSPRNAPASRPNGRSPSPRPRDPQPAPRRRRA